MSALLSRGAGGHSSRREAVLRKEPGFWQVFEAAQKNSARFHFFSTSHERHNNESTKKKHQIISTKQIHKILQCCIPDRLTWLPACLLCSLFFEKEYIGGVVISLTFNWQHYDEYYEAEILKILPSLEILIDNAVERMLLWIMLVNEQTAVTQGITRSFSHLLRKTKGCALTA